MSVPYSYTRTFLTTLLLQLLIFLVHAPFLTYWPTLLSSLGLVIMVLMVPYLTGKEKRDWRAIFANVLGITATTGYLLLLYWVGGLVSK